MNRQTKKTRQPPYRDAVNKLSPIYEVDEIDELDGMEKKSTYLRTLDESRLDYLGTKFQEGQYRRDVIPPQTQPVGNQVYPIHKTKKMKGKKILAYIDTLTTPEDILAYTATLSTQELEDLLKTTLRRAGRRNKKRSTRRKKRRGKKTH